MFVLDISLFPGKQSGGWQQQGVSLENNKHQSDKSSNLVVLRRKLFLRINWIVSERLWFLLISLLKVASLDFCRSLSVLFSAVSLLSIRTHGSTAAAAEADCCQPCPAWPTLNVSGIREGLFQPAKEKPLSVASVVREKIKQLTAKAPPLLSSSLFINNISEIPTKTHLIQTALEVGWWHIAESCQHKQPRRRDLKWVSRSRQLIYRSDLCNMI